MASASDFVIMTGEEHLEKMQIWTGSTVRTEMPYMYALSKDYKSASLISGKHSEALLKMYDELIVNACDHTIDHSSATYIRVNFDIKTGEFMIENDGIGIPVEIHPGASKLKGRPVYIPEMICSIPNSSTNYDRKAGKITGGSLGVADKVVNFHSQMFRVETVDQKGRSYSKTFTNHGKTATADEIGKSARQPYARFTALVDFKSVGYSSMTGKDFDEVEAWLRFRCACISSYSRRISVYFQGTAVPICDPDALTRAYMTLIPDSRCAVSEIKCQQKMWHLGVIVLGVSGAAAKQVRNLSVINGVHVHETTHTQIFRKIILAKMREKYQNTVGKDAKLPASALGPLRLTMVGAIEGQIWKEATKERLVVSGVAVDVPDKFLSDVADQLLDFVYSKTEKKKKVVLKKYMPAKMSRSSHSVYCALAVVEGSSAATFVADGLRSNKQLSVSPVPGRITPNYDYLGIYELGGVVKNALKGIAEYKTSFGETKIERTDKFKKSIKMSNIVAALNLDYSRAYASLDDLSTLTHGYIILHVDADIDAIGKICPLFLTFMFVFWPNLIRHGRVGIFKTPVVRLYKKTTGKSKKKTTGIPDHEFYDEEEFKQWTETNDLSLYSTVYYKGLARHDETDITRMFEYTEYNKNVHIFTLEESDKALFDLYFGKDSKKRQVELSKPIKYLTYNEAKRIAISRLMPCNLQLNIMTKMYKLEAVARQIPSIVDGMTRSRRKILDTSLGTKELRKVFQLCGRVIEEKQYHGGNASIEQTIIKMAQHYVGAHVFPPLIGHGSFGTRDGGGADAGKPRYISVKTSPLAFAIYPDRNILEHRIIDGDIAEPVYFVPVIPMSILDNNNNPSEAWRHLSFARDYASVRKLMIKIISGERKDILAVVDNILEPGAMKKVAELKIHFRPSAIGFSGTFRVSESKLYSVGRYKITDDRVEVLEVPIGVAPRDHFESIATDEKKSLYIESWSNRSGRNDVHIIIELRSGALNQIKETYPEKGGFDSIERFFELFKPMTPHLNYLSHDDRLLSCGKSYTYPFLYWFRIRRDLYKTRLTREAGILELKIILEKNIIRFIIEGPDLSDLEDSAAYKYLMDKKYTQMNTGPLYRPGYMTISEIKSEVLTGPNIKYDYILNLPVRETTKTGLLKHQKDLAKYEAELNELNEHLADKPFPGAKMWLSELKKVDDLIAIGYQTNWKFE